MKTSRNKVIAALITTFVLLTVLSGCTAPDTITQKGIILHSSVSLNAGNPYDTVGQEHNVALTYALAHSDSTCAEGTDTLAYEESIADTVLKPYLDNYYGISSSQFDSIETIVVNHRSDARPNFFDTVSTAAGLTKKEVSYSQRYGNAMSVAARNGHVLDSILAIETAVVNDTWGSGENHIQKMISVAKWSCDFWTNEISSNWLSRLGGGSGGVGGGPPPVSLVLGLH